MRFVWIFAFLFAASSAFAQSHSQFFDYTGYNVYWNGANWTSYASGYGNVLGPNTTTGDFTFYTTGSAASAGLTRTLTQAAAITAAGTVSSTAVQAYTGSFGNITATGTISTAALTVNGVAITSSGGGSGVSATMFPGFPDAIYCMSSDTIYRVFYIQTVTAAVVEYALPVDSGTTRYIINYTKNNGAFSSATDSDLSGDCRTNAWSVAQLYANGRAFNFVGNGGANGVNGYDNIVSSSTKVTANGTGTVSVTNAGVVTGYFDTAGRLVVPGVSSTGPVSVTSLVVAGTMRLGVYTSQPVACGAGYIGLMAMNSATDVCVCNGTQWNRISSGGTACSW